MALMPNFGGKNKFLTTTKKQNDSNNNNNNNNNKRIQKYNCENAHC